jgi:integrase
MSRVRYQEGSLQIKGKGAKADYFTRVRVYDDITGKFTQPRIVIGLVSKMSKREALKKRSEIVAERLHQLPRALPTASSRGATTLETFYRERFLIMKSHWSQAQRDSFEYIMKRFVLPKFGDRAIDSIDKVLVQALLNSLEQKYSKSTIKHVRTKMVEVFEEAVDQDFIMKNPATKTKIPAEARPPEKPVLTADWLNQIITKITDARDKAVFMVATFCALRTSEAFGMPWGNFHHDAETGIGYFMVDQIAYRGKRYKRTKNDASKARVHISAKTLEAILQWQKESSDTGANSLMFPSTNKNGRSMKGAPMYASTWLQKRLQPIAESIGIPFKVNIRATRRTAITLVQENGSSLASAQGMARHASPNTTSGVYTQVIPESVKKAVNDYEALVFGSRPKPTLKRIK